jgi:hypothetical protein
MKYLKKFNEMLDSMGSWNPSQLNDKHEECEECGSYPCECNELLRKAFEIDDEEYDGVPSSYCPECDCIPCQCTGEEYDEDLREGLEENFTDWRINSYLKIARDKYNGMTSEEIIDKIDNGPETMRFRNEEEKELFKEKWDNEKKEGAFSYYNSMTPEELRSLADTFKHDFDNPAQHDPKFVAYLKACELKKVFADKKEHIPNVKDNNFSRRIIY